MLIVNQEVGGNAYKIGQSEHIDFVILVGINYI
jgi:hypothetical protein